MLFESSLSRMRLDLLCWFGWDHNCKMWNKKFQHIVKYRDIFPFQSFNFVEIKWMRDQGTLTEMQNLNSPFWSAMFTNQMCSSNIRKHCPSALVIVLSQFNCCLISRTCQLNFLYENTLKPHEMHWNYVLQIKCRQLPNLRHIEYLQN